MEWNEQEMRESFSKKEELASGHARIDRRASRKNGPGAALARKQADQWAAKEDLCRYIKDSNYLTSREVFHSWLKELKSRPMKPGSEVDNEDAYNEAFQRAIDEFLSE